eukprot:2103584-Prymnesium_polylepis.1
MACLSRAIVQPVSDLVTRKRVRARPGVSPSSIWICAICPEAGPLVETRFLGNTSRSAPTRRKRARLPVVKLESCSACTRS